MTFMCHGRNGLFVASSVTLVLMAAGCGGGDSSDKSVVRHPLRVVEERPGGRTVSVGFLRASLELPRGGRYTSDDPGFPDHSLWSRQLGADATARGCAVGLLISAYTDRPGRTVASGDDPRRRSVRRLAASVTLRTETGASRRLATRGFITEDDGGLLASAVTTLPRDVAREYPKREFVVNVLFFGSESERCRKPAGTAARSAIAVALGDVHLETTGRFAAPAPARRAETVRAGSVPGLRVDGVQRDGLLGSEVSSAGDLNGDGRPDFVAGAGNASVGRRFGAGSVLAVFGSRRAGRVSARSSGRVLRIDGPRKDAQMQAAASVGDVTGDGLDDLAVGAPNAGRGGVVYVVAGRRSGGRIDLASRNGPHVRITGAGGCADLGQEVVDVGDVNADGIGDLGITAPDNCGSGNAGAWIVFGRRRARDVDLRRLGSDGLHIDWPGDPLELADLQLAGAGDIDGDGVRDLVLGAHFAGNPDGADAGPGLVWVVYGKRDGGTVSLARLGAGGVRFGGVGCDSAGMSVAGVGDVNADDLADVAIGAPQGCSDARNPGGVVYVVHGSRGLRGGSLPAVVRRAGMRINGIEGQSIGHQVARLGDHDGDGRDDLLISQPGEVHLVLSPRATDPRVVALRRVGSRAIRLIGPGGSESFGDALASTGDLDGDGLREVLVGDSIAKRRGRAVGAVHLVFSRALAR